MFPQNEVKVWGSTARGGGVQENGQRVEMKNAKEEPNLSRKRVSAVLAKSELAASVFHLFRNNSAQLKPWAESNLTVEHTPLAQYCRLIKVCSYCSDKLYSIVHEFISLHFTSLHFTPVIKLIYRLCLARLLYLGSVRLKMTSEAGETCSQRPAAERGLRCSVSTTRVAEMPPNLS